MTQSDRMPTSCPPSRAFAGLLRGLRYREREVRPRGGRGESLASLDSRVRRSREGEVLLGWSDSGRQLPLSSVNSARTWWRVIPPGRNSAVGAARPSRSALERRELGTGVAQLSRPSVAGDRSRSRGSSRRGAHQRRRARRPRALTLGSSASARGSPCRGRPHLRTLAVSRLGPPGRAGAGGTRASPAEEPHRFWAGRSRGGPRHAAQPAAAGEKRGRAAPLRQSRNLRRSAVGGVGSRECQPRLPDVEAYMDSALHDARWGYYAATW